MSKLSMYTNEVKGFYSFFAAYDCLLRHVL